MKEAVPHGNKNSTNCVIALRSSISIDNQHERNWLQFGAQAFVCQRGWVDRVGREKKARSGGVAAVSTSPGRSRRTNSEDEDEDDDDDDNTTLGHVSRGGLGSKGGTWMTSQAGMECQQCCAHQAVTDDSFIREPRREAGVKVEREEPPLVMEPHGG